MSVRLLAILLLVQCCFALSGAAAEQPTEACIAHGNAVIKIIEAANYCKTVNDCTVLSYSCGTPVNHNEASKVEAAEKAFQTACGTPMLRCAHWTTLLCEQSKCLVR